MQTKLARGTQIIYRPSHIKDTKDFGYPNGAQPGFVTSGPTSPEQSARGECYFCRYWIIKAGKLAVRDLRTKANSELTPVDAIEVVDSVPQEWVDEMLLKYC